MSKKSAFVVIGCFTLVFCACAQAQSMKGPSLGFIFDPAMRGIRPIWGVPGDAILGRPGDYGIRIAGAAVAPRGGYALAEAQLVGGVFVLQLTGTAVTPQPIAGVLPDADTIAFSPSADSAVLYHRALGKIQLLTGLPAAPQLSGEIIAANLPAPLTSLAVSDGATAILAGVSDGHAGSVQRLTAGGVMIPVFAAQMPSAIAFLNGLDSALVADSAGNQVALIQHVSGAVQASTVATSVEGIAQPAAVQPSLDNRFAVVANAGSKTITMVNLQSGTANSVACGCQPAFLARWKGSAVFQVGALQDGSLVAFDGDQGRARVVFIGGAEGRRPVTRPIHPEH